MTRKGIILAGGTGSRLYPSTYSISKQLIPIYDKPMIFYPLSTFLTNGITEVLIISNPRDLNSFKNIFKDGSDLGINICYEEQENPNGLAEAFIIGEKFIKGDKCSLILGDNLFYGNPGSYANSKENSDSLGATIFAYKVSEPNRYGVIEFDENKNAISIEEKPKKPKSNYAITGLYFYDENVVEYSKTLTPSKRGELEITDLNNMYLNKNVLKVEIMDGSSHWFDTGTHDALLEASNFVKALQSRLGKIISSPDEISFNLGLIDKNQILKNALKYQGSSYGDYLRELAEK